MEEAAEIIMVAKRILDHIATCMRDRMTQKRGLLEKRGEPLSLHGWHGSSQAHVALMKKKADDKYEKTAHVGEKIKDTHQFVQLKRANQSRVKCKYIVAYTKIISDTQPSKC